MPKNPPILQIFFWILIPGVLWLSLFCLRPVFVHPWCAVQPTPCTASSINALDQVGLVYHSIFADFLSNLVQNFVGMLVITVPFLLIKNRKQVFQIEYALVLGTLWNGVLLEATRTLVQRPRPLVIGSPMIEGAQIYQYTSFYSGHTSFVAFATLFLVLCLYSEFGFSHLYTKLSSFGFAFFTILTALLRIWGGRHYPSDTLAGAFAGSLIATLLWFLIFRLKIFRLNLIVF